MTSPVFSSVLFALEWGLPFAAAALSVCIHHYAIRLVSKRMPVRGYRSAAPNMIHSLLVLIAAHLVEIGAFALAYFVLQSAAVEPVLTGSFSRSLQDYLYYSATTYSSLGLGDVYPAGPAKLLTGIEALVGLILIAWTAAFLFAETERAEGL